MAMKPCAPKMSCTSRANSAKPRICLAFFRRYAVAPAGEFFGSGLKLGLPVQCLFFGEFQEEPAHRPRRPFQPPIVMQLEMSPLRYKYARAARCLKGAAEPRNRQRTRSSDHRCGQDLRHVVQEIP